MEAHLPDPGRLEELLVEGRRMRLRPAAAPGRKTDWTAVLVESPGGEGWVSIGASRFDFSLRKEDPSRQLVLEVKSVTLVEEGLGLFPDAVTARGARHVRELAELAGSGDRAAAVLFLVQRDDAEAVMAAPSIDPDFAAALESARREGVRVLARRCSVDTECVSLDEPIPVRWPAAG